MISGSHGNEPIGALIARLRAASGSHSTPRPGTQGADADLYGNPSKPQMNRVYEIAAAASTLTLMGQTAAAHPVVIARDVPYTADEHATLTPLLTPPPLPELDYDLTPISMQLLRPWVS